MQRFRLFGQLSGRNKLKGPGSRLLVSPFPESNSSCLVAGCCEACGQPPTCGQGGGNARRFPRLVHRGPRLRGQAGIGAADCPQIHSTCSTWRQAASVAAAIVIVPGFLFIQTTWGVPAVFGTIAVMLAVAAVAVTQIGSETRGLALD